VTPARIRRLFAIGWILVFTAAAQMAPREAQAQKGYPDDIIHFISGYAVGSGADVLVRYFAEKVGRLSGATIVVENKPGATGNIATEYAARSKPNGYTVLVHAGSGLAGNMHLYKTNVDVTKDLQLVATINKQGTFLVVSADSPYKTIGELAAAMKAKKDKASYGTSSTTGTITGEMFKQVAGLDTMLVNYKSSPDTIKDLVGGQLDYAMVDPLLGLAEQRKGRVRVLANCAPERMTSSPDVPTMIESGFNMSLVGWWAAAVPAETPRPIVDQLNAWFNQVLATQETKTFLENAGGDVFISNPDDAQKLLTNDVKAWGEHIRIGKIQRAG